MFQIFDPSVIHPFADVIVQIFLPAITDAIRAIGSLINVIHIFLRIPVVKDAAEFLATLLLITRGVVLIREGFAAIGTLLYVFAAQFFKFTRDANG